MSITYPRLALGAAFALLVSASSVIAQQPGIVEGRAVEAGGGAPLRLALVRLAADRDSTQRTTLTDSAGAFRFAAVAPGSYRLTLERIGYARTSPERVTVDAGATVQRTLTSAARAVMLEGITAVGNRCFTLAQLGEEPDLAELWTQVRRGQETRRAFSAQYAFQFNRHVDATARLHLLRDRHIVQDTLVANHPDSVAPREARRIADRAARGYGTQHGGSFMVALPDETEVMSDAFLTTHCLMAPERDASGGWALRFRPLTTVHGRIDLRGTLHVDAASFAVTRLDFEHMRDGHRWAWGTLFYAPVATPFGSVRLPSHGTVEGDPSGATSLILSHMAGTITFRNYRGFSKVR
jgi:hypothetical protein